MIPPRALLGLLLALAPGCGGSGARGDAGPGDAPSGTDAGPALAACARAPLPATAGAGGTVVAGPLRAGAAEARLDLPVGSSLGAYTGRVAFASPPPDGRAWPWSGPFHPSVGIETAPRARALALSAGGETVVLVTADLGVAFEGLTHDLAARLGLPGKVLVAVSHSHSSFGHYSANPAMGLAFSRFRRAQYDALLGRLETTARAALAARRPARIGISVDTAFDLADAVTHDRRPENDRLAGGPRKDSTLFVIRVDGTDGRPIAVVPVFGVHGTVLDYDNPLASTDAPGAIARALEESFDEPVVVLHLQGAAGDVSPSGGRGLDCTGQPSCQDLARSESVGRAALPFLRAAWLAAGEHETDSLALELLTRSIELGPRPETFTVRGGALRYAPWDGTTPGDGRIFDADGGVLSPIDEFNAPFGASLCGSPGAGFSLGVGQLPGASQPGPYHSCTALDAAGPIVGRVFEVDLDTLPTCASTRTTVSALRLGEHLLVTLPGEPVTLLADRVRALSPAPPGKTIVVGYAQGHVGYLLTADDWLQGGYEPSINFWGPLEGEYVAEQALRLAALAMTEEREDGAAGGTDRWITPATTDDREVPAPDPAPLAGTVPAVVPAGLYVPLGASLGSAQPSAEVPRLSTAHLAWIGEDPLAGTPIVTLQRETAAGAGQFTDVTRRSGRPVQDGDLVVAWTPLPLRRAPGEHATHHWVVAWQAVTWWGVTGIPGVSDALGDRAGVPLGRYRFHVQGTGYALDSRPFTVVPAPLVVTASRSAGALALRVAVPGTGGFRLLDEAVPSNGPVPLRGGLVHVVWRDAAGGRLGEADAGVDGAGGVALEVGAAAPRVRSVTVTDRFGNLGDAPLEDAMR